jgi:hypothetical protein
MDGWMNEMDGWKPTRGGRGTHLTIVTSGVSRHNHTAITGPLPLF